MSIDVNLKISKGKAQKIADSLYDLGDVQKKIIVFILSGKKVSDLEPLKNYPQLNSAPESALDEKKDLAYKALDTISRLIVDQIATAEDLDDAHTNLEYTIRCLRSALDGINKVNQ